MGNNWVGLLYVLCLELDGPWGGGQIRTADRKTSIGNEVVLCCAWLLLCAVLSLSVMSNSGDCSPPGSSVHGDSPGKNMEWVPMPSSRDLPNPGIEPRSLTLKADSFLSEPPEKPKNTGVGSLSLLQGISWPRNQARVSWIEGRSFSSWTTREQPAKRHLTDYHMPH